VSELAPHGPHRRVVVGLNGGVDGTLAWLLLLGCLLLELVRTHGGQARNTRRRAIIGWTHNSPGYLGRDPGMRLDVFRFLNSRYFFFSPIAPIGCGRRGKASRDGDDLRPR